MCNVSRVLEPSRSELSQAERGPAEAKQVRIVLCFDGHARPVVSGLWSQDDDWIHQLIESKIAIDITDFPCTCMGSRCEP